MMMSPAPLVWMILLFSLAAGAAVGGNVPGARFDIDWPKAVSAGDVTLNAPAPDSYQGLILGNGDIGTSLFGNPELITIHVGKNDIWDYRDFMDDKRPVTHKEFLAKYADTSKPPLTNYFYDPAVDAHNVDIRLTYLRGVPSAKPAGQIRFRNKGFAGRAYEAKLHLWNATASATAGGTEPALDTFVSYPRNLIISRYDPGDAGEFDIELARHKDCTGLIPNDPEFGASGRDIWVRYVFPADPANYPKGFEYVMYGRIIGGDAVTTEVIKNFAEIDGAVWRDGQVALKTVKATEGVAIAHVNSSKPITLLVALFTTRDDPHPLQRARREIESAEKIGLEKLTSEHQAWWHNYWQKSFIDLSGKPFLNGVWFFSQYLLASSSREGKLAPGLFGPWTWEDYPLFGNDYHWDYNMQQVIWGAYSSNHLEQTRAYNEAALALLPTAKADALETYGIDGAKFFLSSYPRKHPHNPFPLLHYDKMMSLNGWVAHPLWWMFLYGQDKSYLRKQAYPLMRECAKFYESYLTQDSDGKYDIWPTAAWDVDFTPHLRDNCGFPMDLSFVRYLLRACAQASEVLDVDKEKRAVWRLIADNMREYPTMDTPSGKIYTAYPGSNSTYHFSLAATMVFPGDDIGLHSPPEQLDTARRTISPMTYSGDEQLLKAVIRARLGVDDIDRFEQQLRATIRPNGMMSYPDQWFFWVHSAGNSIWHNENLMQSYNGQIRVAPVKMQIPARFANLRAVGGFLVSAEIERGGEVAYIAITSEARQMCKLVKPWEGKIRVRVLPAMEQVKFITSGKCISFTTRKQATYIIDRPSKPWEKQPLTHLPYSIQGVTLTGIKG